MSAPVAPAIPDEVLEIARTLEAAGHEAWCVGGALRDALLGHPHSDYDFATSATPAQITALFRRTAPVGEKYGTVGVLDRFRVLHEVTTFRRDVATDGRHAVVAYGVSLEEDLARRDFTINAIAYHPLRGEWRDPFGGRADLARGLIRAVGEPAERFREDYLRILRGLRFAARLGFTTRAGHVGRRGRGRAGSRAALRRAGAGRMVQGSPHGALAGGAGGALDPGRSGRTVDAGARVGPDGAPGTRCARCPPTVATRSCSRWCCSTTQHRCSGACARRTPRSSAPRPSRAGPPPLRVATPAPSVAGSQPWAAPRTTCSPWSSSVPAWRRRGLQPSARFASAASRSPAATWR